MNKEYILRVKRALENEIPFISENICKLVKVYIDTVQYLVLELTEVSIVEFWGLFRLKFTSDKFRLDYVAP